MCGSKISISDSSNLVPWYMLWLFIMNIEMLQTRHSKQIHFPLHDTKHQKGFISILCVLFCYDSDHQPEELNMHEHKVFVCTSLRILLQLARMQVISICYSSVLIH
jgi:hypothetical protein